MERRYHSRMWQKESKRNLSLLYLFEGYWLPFLDSTLPSPYADHFMSIVTLGPHKAGRERRDKIQPNPLEVLTLTFIPCSTAGLLYWMTCRCFLILLIYQCNLLCTWSNNCFASVYLVVQWKPWKMTGFKYHTSAK